MQQPHCFLKAMLLKLWNSVVDTHRYNYSIFYYEIVLLLIFSLHIYLSYIFKYKLHSFNVYKMFMNRTIHDTIRFTIQNLSSPIHDTIHDSTTMFSANDKVIKWEIISCMSVHKKY